MAENRGFFEEENADTTKVAATMSHPILPPNSLSPFVKHVLAGKGPTPEREFQNGSSKTELPRRKLKQLPVSKMELQLSANGK